MTARGIFFGGVAAVAFTGMVALVTLAGQWWMSRVEQPITFDKAVLAVMNYCSDVADRNGVLADYDRMVFVKECTENEWERRYGK